jgi:NAD(P)-dependent dehydrogenase (short-subunit alcohol dehydrogenase family)
MPQQNSLILSEVEGRTDRTAAMAIAGKLAPSNTQASVRRRTIMALLQDKICVITGGAGSIGKASAQLFLAEGAKVMLVDLHETDLKRAVAELSSDKVAATAADVSKAAAVKAYVDATVARWGKIDVLFSNAGNAGAVTPVTEYPEDVFDDVLAVHVRGAFLACKYGLPAMRDGGSIIITSSIVGVRGDRGGSCAYVTAKHAQVGLMRSVAKGAAARRIRVNTLHPGPVDNEFQTAIERNISAMTGRDATAMLNQNIPLGRHAQADEIARSALYLASDMSSFTTGTTLMVDGGSSA